MQGQSVEKIAPPEDLKDSMPKQARTVPMHSVRR